MYNIIIFIRNRICSQYDYMPALLVIFFPLNLKVDILDCMIFFYLGLIVLEVDRIELNNSAMRVGEGSKRNAMMIPKFFSCRQCNTTLTTRREEYPYI